MHTQKHNTKTQLAPFLKCCPHTPIEDADIWNNPQDEWCDFCQCSCCRQCFQTAHKNCLDRSGTSMTLKINKERASRYKQVKGKSTEKIEFDETKAKK